MRTLRSRQRFLSNGVTKACFMFCGTTPDCRDALMMLVSIGGNSSMLSFSMFVGIGSKSHV